MRLGTGELLLILAAVLLIFGPTKLPQFGDALGRTIRNFKKGIHGGGAEAEADAAAPAALPPAAPQPRVETSGEREVARAQRA
jgi:sec-independent protein translocase protein TatA